MAQWQNLLGRLRLCELSLMLAGGQEGAEAKTTNKYVIVCVYCMLLNARIHVAISLTVALAFRMRYSLIGVASYPGFPHFRENVESLDTRL